MGGGGPAVICAPATVLAYGGTSGAECMQSPSGMIRIQDLPTLPLVVLVPVVVVVEVVE